MKFITTSLPGVWIVELEPRIDERGFLARTYCQKEFAEQCLNIDWPQCNLTRTRQRGMIRGLHYQADPKPETKLIRCGAGAVFDVVADLRPGSPTYGRWEGFMLDSRSHRSLYVPGGCAHGFQCLRNHCELFYQMSEFYHPELARGIRWNDPLLAIKWPILNPILSERDQKLPFL